MAASTPKAASTDAKERDAAAKAKDKEKAAKAKEKAAKAKEKERAAKAKEKERAQKAKEKEKAAKAKDKERAQKAKDKERAAKAKEKEKAAKAKDKERAQKAKDKDEAAKAKAGEQQKADEQRKADEQAKADGQGKADGQAKAEGKATADTAPDVPSAQADDAAPVQAVEDVAVAERGESDEVPGAARAEAPLLDRVPDEDTTIRPFGYIAEALGKEDAVGRSTQRATLAASYTTRDHDIIRAWAETRGGVPADVAGTGDGGAGVLRVEFPDGPGDDSKLEAVDWSAFFATFDDSDVDFLYQERVRTGATSRFHKFVRADA